MNVDIMCETLHHLNNLHAKCCKPLFDTYWVMSQRQLHEHWFLSAQDLKFYLHKHGLLRGPTKKSNSVQSDDFGGQLISPR